MKSNSFILILFLSILVSSCVDDLTSIGTKIQPSQDAISVGTDTFHVSTENIFVEYMYSRPDSFLLGTFYDKDYGTTQADILAQVNCPVNFKYPATSKVDSALIVLYYKTWFGDKYSPLDVNIYEMDKQTFTYSGLYKTSLNPDEYTSKLTLLSNRIISARDASKKGKDSTFIKFKMLPSPNDGLSKDFVTRFFNINPDTYSSESKFTEFFKGMYITANYGASTILNIRQIDLELYYHYTETVKSKSGADSIITRKDVKTFPANPEVRQVNRFLHPDTTAIKNQLKLKDSVNYVSSPANIQTRVILPMKRIKTRMDNDSRTKGKSLTVNSALLQVEVAQATEEDKTKLIPMPVIRYMLLIKESAMVDFFRKNELPNDTTAMLATYSSSLIYNTTLYQSYYTFNVAKLIANELKQHPTSIDEKLNMRLVPVRVTLDANSNVTAVNQEFLLSGVTIRSGLNKSPMRIKMVYSGF
ncbi:MAG: DUF4270 domain-containing protein [Paludibacter sp.]